MERQTTTFLAAWLFVSVIGLCQGATTTFAPTSPNADPLTVATSPSPDATTVATTLLTVTDNATTIEPTDATVMTSTFTEETMTTVNGSTPEVTTKASHTTTHRPIPTYTPDVKPPIGTWSIKDANNKTCMKMQMGVRFNIYFTNSSNQVDMATIDAPLSAYPEGKCDDGELREFKLHLFNDGKLSFFYVYLDFEKSSTYKLTKIGSFYTVTAKRFRNPLTYSQEWQSIESDNYLNNSIPLGKSFTCGHTLSYPGVFVTFYDVKFMPFAEEAQGDFGKSVECKNIADESWKGILVIIAIVAVIALSVVGCVVGCRKYKKSRRADDMRPIIQNANC